ncbi:MAG: hypothetical protein PHP74_03330, partial [Candidatus Gracilibacteria bacterium]|nr:hypothetical protein [Candidatus Gracilibacteria bacterium]
VKSAESAMEYFDKKSNASETEAAINKLRKGVILVAGQPLTDANSKNIANAKSKNPDVSSYSLPIKETLVELNSIISTQGKLESIVQPINATSANGVTVDFDEQRRNAGQKKARAEKDKEFISGIQSEAKAFHGQLLAFAEQATFLAKNGFLDSFYDPDQIEKLASELKGLDPMVANVSVKDLNLIYEELERGLWFKIFNDKSLGNKFSSKIADYNKDVKEAENDLGKKQDALKASKDLSDSEAAKRIMFAVVKKQHPELSLEEQHNLADLILADDVERIQTQKSYAELANEGSEDYKTLLDQAGDYNFRWKVLKFKYQSGGKTYEPFKGLKPTDLDDWSKIEKQFTIAGKFDYQVGFFFLAALKSNEISEDKGSFTIVYKKLEKKLKSIIADRLGVSQRMGESYIRRVVDEAFEDQLKQSGDLMQAHFEHYSKNSNDINSAKVKELKRRLEVIKEKRKLEKIDQEEYEEKYAEILEESREYGIDKEIDLIQNAALTGYLNSPESQKVKDFGVDVGRYLKDKSFAFLDGTKTTAANALVGSVKVGASLAFNTLATPVRALKYPAFVAVKPIAFVANKLKEGSLTSPQIIQTTKQDIGRIGNYFKTLGSNSIAGAKSKTKEAYKTPWEQAKFKSVKYSERTKFNMEKEESRVKDLSGKSILNPLEIGNAPTIDFEDFRAKIESNEKAHGSGSALSSPKKTESKNNPVGNASGTPGNEISQAA